MTKYKELGSLAEELYVKKGKTLTEISLQLDLSMRTLGIWKRDGCWEAKRAEERRTVRDMVDDFIATGRILAKKLRDHVENPKTKPPLTDDESKILAQILPKIKSQITIGEESTAKTDARTPEERLSDAMDRFL